MTAPTRLPRAAAALLVALTAAAPHTPTASDSLTVDPSRSLVRWTGTKFGGRGRHAGTVGVSGGWLRGDPAGGGGSVGEVVVDLRTLAVTDIPAHEPVPRARLERHLRDSAFFWVDRYPTATLRLRGARPVGARGASGAGGAFGPRRWRVAGDLALRGRVAPVAFDVDATPLPGGALRAAGRLVIDRQRWGVAFRGARLTNDLVDDPIALDLTLVAAPAPPAAR